MKRRSLPIVLLVSLLTCALPAAEPEQSPSRLCVLWTSADPDVAKNVCFMYTTAAKKAGWFDVVHLVVWGPSAKLLSEEESLQLPNVNLPWIPMILIGDFSSLLPQQKILLTLQRFSK